MRRATSRQGLPQSIVCRRRAALYVGVRLRGALALHLEDLLHGLVFGVDALRAAARAPAPALELLQARVREVVVREVPVQRGEADEERADDVAEVRGDERPAVVSVRGHLLGYVEGTHLRMYSAVVNYRWV